MGEGVLKPNKKRLVSYTDNEHYRDLSDVNLQDQTTPAVIGKFHRVDVVTELTAVTAIEDLTIDVDDATGILVGHYLIIYSPVINKYYLGTVLSIAVNTLTLDTPLDRAFPIGAIVTTGISNMSVDGSTTPQVFGLRGAEVLPEGIDLVFDITRIIFHCITATPLDLTEFADIAALTNGMVMRKRNGEYDNIFNVKSNGEMAGIMYDFNIVAATNPAQGVDGFYGRLTFAGQNKIGVVQRLNKGEDLEILIRDDLTDITLLEIVAEGHIVD